MTEPPPGSPLPLTARPRLARQVRAQTDKVSGKPILLYPEGVLQLNPTGDAILKLCDGQHTVSEIITALAERYQAPADQLAVDVLDYLQRLRVRRLLDPGIELEQEI